MAVAFYTKGKSKKGYRLVGEIMEITKVEKSNNEMCPIAEKPKISEGLDISCVEKVWQKEEKLKNLGIRS